MRPLQNKDEDRSEPVLSISEGITAAHEEIKVEAHPAGEDHFAHAGHAAAEGSAVQADEAEKHISVKEGTQKQPSFIDRGEQEMKELQHIAGRSDESQPHMPLVQDVFLYGIIGDEQTKHHAKTRDTQPQTACLFLCVMTMTIAKAAHI